MDDEVRGHEQYERHKVSCVRTHNNNININNNYNYNYYYNQHKHGGKDAH
jgi:hypothetical protein